MGAGAQLNESLLKKAQLELPAFYDAIRCLVMALSVVPLMEKKVKTMPSRTEEKRILSSTLLHACVQSALIDWYRLFDANGGNQYWKQITLEQDEFRKQVYDETGFNYSQWSSFRRKLGDWHSEILNGKGINPEVYEGKELETMLQVFRVSHRWIYKLFQEADMSLEGELDRKNYIDEFIGEVKTVLSNMIDDKKP